MADQARPVDRPPASDADTAELPPSGTPGRPAYVGRYRIRRRLGAGGMGDVFEADDPALGRTVAVKVIRPGPADPLLARERFRREARAAAALQHDHVVPVFDFDADGRSPYLVMPLLAGETLKDRLQRDPTLTIADVLRVGRETALALAAAHAAGLVHRDVKPSNLWLEATPAGWRVRVLDFGLARTIDGRDRVTEPGPSPGTLAYMSPEQLRGDPLDGRTDLYSLGVVLYEAAAGRQPDPGSAEGAPPPAALNPDVPAGVSAYILKLMSRRPEDRPPVAAAVAADLAALAAALPTAETKSDPDSTVTPPPAPPPGRRVPWQLVAGALVVLLTVVGVWHLWPPGDGPPSGKGPGRGGRAFSTATPIPETFADPLRVRSLEVRHFAAQGAGSLDRGLLGQQSFAPRLGDQVTVQAHLTHPAHAFLIAFRADGTAELCFPEDPDVPAPMTDRPRYPQVSRDEPYGLREGAGLWAFAVVASDRPLPPYRRWVAGREIRWRPEAVPAGTVWYDDGQWVEALGPAGPARGDRGKGEAVPGQSAVVRLTNALSAGGATAAALGFVVEP